MLPFGLYFSLWVVYKPNHSGGISLCQLILLKVQSLNQKTLR